MKRLLYVVLIIIVVIWLWGHIWTAGIFIGGFCVGYAVRKYGGPEDPEQIIGDPFP
jgi:hypothetical protein